MPKHDQHANADCKIVIDDPRLKRVAGDLRALLRNGVRILASEGKGEVPTGQSKLGGRPDLPVDVVTERLTLGHP